MKSRSSFYGRVKILLICVLLFDVWYGPAVLHQRPGPRRRTVSTDGGELQREVEAELDEEHRLCTVRIRLRRLCDGGGASETAEGHRVRFFFPRELQAALRGADFALLRLGAFPAFDAEPDETTWNVLAVARAVAAWSHTSW